MAGKKILTQFALPVGSTSGSFGNGTAGQVLTSGGASASMYWGTPSGTSVSGYIPNLVSDSTNYYTHQHDLGTFNLFVSVRRYHAANGNTSKSRAERFTDEEGAFLDLGYDYEVISCTSTGEVSNNHLSFYFETAYNEYLYFSIMKA